MNYNTGTVDCQ